MTPGDNAAAMHTHATHSDARDVTARALARRWSHLSAVRPRPRICDLGTGDGVFLANVLAHLNCAATIEIVEPDETLAPLALQRLGAAGHTVIRTTDTGSRSTIDAYLAAHVLFYLDDITAWFDSAVGLLAPEGVLSIVQRAPTCECNKLRKLVRDHYGIPPKISSARIQHLAAEHDMAIDITPLTSTFTYPVDDPRLSAVPAESADPDLARLVCWLAGLPSNQRLPANLRHAINKFLTGRMAGGVLTISQEDELLTTTPRAASTFPGAQPTEASCVE